MSKKTTQEKIIYLFLTHPVHSIFLISFFKRLNVLLYLPIYCVPVCEYVYMYQPSVWRPESIFSQFSLLSCSPERSNFRHKTWRQVHLPAQPSCQPQNFDYITSETLNIHKHLHFISHQYIKDIPTTLKPNATL